MKPNGQKRSHRSVPYYGQRPHKQGKSPHPLLCFSWNLRNAFRRAFPGLQEERRKKKREKSRIECLMDLFNFDINQLLIYETRNRKYKKDCVVHTLRIMKMKVEEVKSLAVNSRSLEKAEAMLKRRERLKCVSRSFRRQLIEHMANYDPSERSSRTMCKIMKRLDGIDADIHSLCKCIKDKAEDSCTDLVKDKADESCSDLVKDKTDESCAELFKVSPCSEKAEDSGGFRRKFPKICTEAMRPYDPTTDEDAQSIHLRYIPELDSFKADMARNPCALRLPLMCPPLKRIMNKMKPCYLMDDVPCKLDGTLPKSGSGGRNVTIGFFQFRHSLGTLNLPKDFEEECPFDSLSHFQNRGTGHTHILKNMGTQNMWLVASQELWQIYP